MAGLGEDKGSIHSSIILGSDHILEVGSSANLPAGGGQGLRRSELGEQKLGFAAFSCSQLGEGVAVVLEGFGEVANTSVVDSVEISGDEGTSSGAVDDFVAALDGRVEGGGVPNVSDHNLHGPGKLAQHMLISFPNQGLDGVSPEHELANQDPADAAGGANHQDGGVLSARNGELAHGSAVPDVVSVVGVVVAVNVNVVGSDGAGDLAQSGEVAPRLVEYLAGFPAQADGINLVQPLFHHRD